MDIVNLKNGDHKSFLKNLWEHVADGLFCDVQLVAEGKVFNAHSIILSAGSPRLKTLLDFSYKNKRNPMLIFEKLTYANLVYLMHYIYQGEVTIAKDEVASFRDTLNFFNVNVAPTESSDSAMNKSFANLPFLSNSDVLSTSLTSSNPRIESSGSMTRKRVSSRDEGPSSSHKKRRTEKSFPAFDFITNPGNKKETWNNHKRNATDEDDDQVSSEDSQSSLKFFKMEASNKGSKRILNPGHEDLKTIAKGSKESAHSSKAANQKKSSRDASSSKPMAPTICSFCSKILGNVRSKVKSTINRIDDSTVNLNFFSENS